MAFKNIEIEVKLKVTKGNFQKIKKEVGNISLKHKSVKHFDIYYYPINRKGYIDTEVYPYKWIRIRKILDVSILTFKHHFPEGEKTHNYCKEYETVIENTNSMDMILNELGLNQKIEVTKMRETYVFKDIIAISFDVVENLGYFIEFEALDLIKSKTKKTIFNFIEKFNFEYEIIDFGYPLLIKKNANKV